MYLTRYNKKHMMKTINLNLHSALTNVTDGINCTVEEDLLYFEKQAKQSFEMVPESLPYVEEYRNSVEKHNFKSALKHLKQFVSYVESYNGDEYRFSYSGIAVDKIIDKTPSQ